MLERVALVQEVWQKTLQKPGLLIDRERKKSKAVRARASERASECEEEGCDWMVVKKREKRRREAGAASFIYFCSSTQQRPSPGH